MSTPESEHEKFTIIVNTRRKTVESATVTFEQAVALAFNPVPANTIFTVTYRGAAHHEEGSLQPGQSVEIKNGTIFNVTDTGQS
jgi:hypothetical protein